MIKVDKAQKIIFGLFVVGSSILYFSADQQNIASAQTAEVDATRPPQRDFTPGPVYLVEINEPEWRENVPLPRLVADSRKIVIGEVVKNKCRKTLNGHQVVTDYEIRVLEVLKGSVNANRPLIVTTPGGLIMQSDGRVINVAAPAVAKLRNGEKFVMFLQDARELGENHSKPINGTQGVFEISGSRVIHLGQSTYIGAEIGDAATFLEQVHTLIQAL